MNKPQINQLFSPSALRTVPDSEKDQPKPASEIYLEIEPLEGSKLYSVLPDFLQDSTKIYGFITSNPLLDEQFISTTPDDLDKRYIIFRESANHFIVLFVSANEKNMHFFRYEKEEIISLMSESFHPIEI